jgi:hypothetical protein
MKRLAVPLYVHSQRLGSPKMVQSSKIKEFVHVALAAYLLLYSV